MPVGGGFAATNVSFRRSMNMSIGLCRECKSCTSPCSSSRLAWQDWQKPRVSQKKPICELTPLELRASCLGGYQMVIGLCSLPASLIIGLLWESFGMFASFYFPLCLTPISSSFLLFVTKQLSFFST
jgi:hypothetical protein